MATLESLMQTANKDFGAKTVVTGDEIKRDPPRLPFGVFPVDFATGGGIPVWGSLCLWGGESAGKTSLALNAVAMVDRICWRCYELESRCTCSGNPKKMRTFWADVEATMDRDWAAAIGANPKSYYYALGDYGEMYVNLAEAALQSDDCGLLVVDSLAALTPSAEFDAAAEDHQIGKQAMMITRCVRRLKQRVIREFRRGHPCAIIFTNQLRTRIGVMFGDPSSMPGGHAMKHEFSLLLRTGKKVLNEADKKRYKGTSDNREAAVRHSFVIKKEKVLTLAVSGEYIRLREWVDTIGSGPGAIDDFQTVATYAKKFALLENDGKDWRCLGEKFPRLTDMVDLWKRDRDTFLYVQRRIIDAAKQELNRSA